MKFTKIVPQFIGTKLFLCKITVEIDVICIKCHRCLLPRIFERKTATLHTYNSDHATNNYHLFIELGKFLAKKHFSNYEEVK